MSRHGDVTREWGDGEYVFRFALREWEKIDETFDVGPYEFYRRLSLGTWRVKNHTSYPREAIRVMLQGGGSVVTASGGIDDMRINRLLKEYVDNRPMMPVVDFVTATIGLILTEPEDDKIPKLPAAEEMPRSSQTGSFPLPPSSDGARPSPIPQTTSADSPSGSSEPASPDTSPPMAQRKSSRPRHPRNSTQ